MSFWTYVILSLSAATLAVIELLGLEWVWSLFCRKRREHKADEDATYLSDIGRYND